MRDDAAARSALGGVFFFALKPYSRGQKAADLFANLVRGTLGKLLAHVFEDIFLLVLNLGVRTVVDSRQQRGDA